MSIDKADFELKKQALIDHFLLNDKVESDEERDKAFEKLSIEIFKLTLDKADSLEGENLNNFWEIFKAKLAELECNDPRLAHAVNGLKKIGRSKYGEASKYVEKLLEMKKEEFSLAQWSKGIKPKKQDQLILLLKSYIRNKPDITSAEVLIRIRSSVNNGVIIDVTEDEIIYTNDPPHGDILRKAAVSGLRNKLNRLKNNNQARGE
jgi:hypothetical protein